MMAEFFFRDARREDREEILALSELALDGEDYVGWVFEDWVKDSGGRFLAVVDSGSGRIVAIDKLTMQSPREAWFEGLRVHPDFRGRGLYTQVERYMIGEAQRLGAEVIRFLTRSDNSAIHRNAYRHGFNLRSMVRGWTWSPGADPTASSSQGTGEAAPLRTANPEEAAQLYGWWQRTALAAATGGLLNRGWSFSETSSREWEERAEKGELWISEETRVAESVLPPPFVLLSEATYDEASGPEWDIAALAGIGDELETLLRSLRSEALRRTIGEMSAVLPDSHELYTAMLEAGFGPVEGYGAMALFELTFEP